MKICETKQQTSEKPLPFFIAELSANHCGDYDLAVEMVKAAAKAGCWAAKIQIFKPEHLTLPERTERFKLPDDSPWAGQYLWDLYTKTQTPWDWLPRLMEVGLKEGIWVFPSVYHPEAVEFCKRHGALMYKVASFEIGYEELLRAIASTKKSVFVSMGCATDDEIWAVLNIFENQVECLLHCLSQYPAKAESYNLSRLLELRRLGGGVPIGLSDHTITPVAAIASVPYSVSIIEKHLTLRSDAPDAAFSVFPDTLRITIEACQEARKACEQKPWTPSTRYKRRWIDGNFVRTVT